MLSAHNPVETNGLVTILVFVSREQIADGHLVGSPERTYEHALLKTYRLRFFEHPSRMLSE